MYLDAFDAANAFVLSLVCQHGSVDDVTNGVDSVNIINVENYE